MGKKKFRSYIGLGCILILIFWIVNHMGQLLALISIGAGIIMPFIVGACIAFILNVPMKEIEKHIFNSEKTKKFKKFRRVIAFFITFIAVIAIITLALFVIIPEVVNTGSQLMKQIPAATDELIAFLERTGQQYPVATDQITQWISNFKFDINSLMDMGVTNLLTSGIAAVTGVLSGFINFFIGIVFAIYILFEKDNLCRQIKKLIYRVFSKKRAERILFVSRLSNVTFSNFLRGQCLEAVILGSMFCIIMSIIGLPYAFLIGILIAFTALVPIVGAFVGCILGAFFIAIVNPMQALIFIILFLVLQQVEGNLIYPHVVGNSIGLPGIWVLVAVTVGGKLFGVLGMLIFIPICSVCYALLRTFVNEKEQSKTPEEKDTKTNTEKTVKVKQIEEIK